MESRAPTTSATGEIADPRGGDFVDQGPISRGGQGEIRRALEASLLRPLAMKILDERLAPDPAHRKRFVEEAQITAQLDHPNIPPVHRIGLDANGRFFFTMKLVRGRTLEDHLRARPYTSDEWPELLEILEVFLTVCDAVSFAHGRGVVHRDLKPENIMTASHSQVYVMDWGVARLVGQQRPSGQDRLPPVRVWSSSQNERGVIAGTPEFMAPEQALGDTDAIDTCTDVFALGAILYRIFSGRAPYDGASVVEVLGKAARAEFPHPSAAAGTELPEAICAIILRAMRRDPRERYPTVDALRDDVRAFTKYPPHLLMRTFEAGATIVREGDPADAAYIILSGRAHVYKTLGGRRMFVRELGPNSAFGEAAIFSSQTRTATVEAVERLQAVRVTRAALEQELSHASLLAPLVRELAHRFDEVDRELTDQRFGTAYHPIASAALLYFGLHAMPTSPTQRAVAWSPLCDYLCAKFSSEATLITEAVRTIPGAQIDLGADTLVIGA